MDRQAQNNRAPYKDFQNNLDFNLQPYEIIALTLILSITFCPENVVSFMSVAYIQMHFRLLLIMEA